MSRPIAPEGIAPELDIVASDAGHTDSIVKTPPVQVDDVPVVAPVRREEPVVTRKELWSYYLYYNGDNGVGPNGYSMTLFQSLATSAGYDPVNGPGSSCTAATSSGKCVLPWGSGTKAVSSIVLVASGVSFAIMTLIFTTIGSAADYGTFGRWLLLVITVICWGAQFASMSLTSPSRWGVAMALYMIAFITYGATLVFYAALFPRLARNTPHARSLRERLDSGEITVEVYETEESMEKNRISNISTMHSNIGYIVTLALNLSLLLPLANNPKVDNYVLVLTTGYWIWAALKQYKKLPYTFTYLVAFFLLADGLNTTGTLINICQNDKFEFSFCTTPIWASPRPPHPRSGITGLSPSPVRHRSRTARSTLGFWYIQKYWKIPTKKMFVVTNVVTIMIPLWGMIGIWTPRLGFHNVWEFWAYNVVFGLFQAPYYAFSQTMMAELTPPGFDNMFFGLFGLSNRASSMIGPNVVQAIVDNTGDNWKGFPFLFALCAAASVVIWFGVDVPAGRRDAVAWAHKHRSYAETGLIGDDESVDAKELVGRS
ncbi:MFS general substrate transporter [Amylocystis lapponica]|nr:MFS general substrate transporter [Amylocystis lapponica]